MSETDFAAFTTKDVLLSCQQKDLLAPDGLRRLIGDQKRPLPDGFYVRTFGHRRHILIHRLPDAG